MSAVNGVENDISSKFQDLCADLNMDKTAADEAWNEFVRIGNTYTLEGDSLHWLACALYVSCRSCAIPTVSRGYIEGNCVSLARLLRSCKLSLVQFFAKMKNWADMANLSKEMRDRVNTLERSFNVSTVIFKKFMPIFKSIFKDPSEDPPRPPRSRKQKKLPCTSSDVCSFCWTLFIRVKGSFPAISEDLVNSFHLLLCCIDLLFSNALLANRKDLLNPRFTGLPQNFFKDDYTPPTDVPCIIDMLCSNHQGILTEAKGIKEHMWKKHLCKMIEKKVLKGKAETLTALLDLQNFDTNSKAINKEYEEHVLNAGDIDERIFLGEKASEEIGTPAKQYNEIAERIQKRNLEQHMKETKSLYPSTPLTGRNYLKDKEAAYVTPVSTATQSVSRLQTLLSGREAQPGEILSDIFKECACNPEEKIKSRVKEMGETFCTCYTMPSEDNPGTQYCEFAKKRLQLAEKLYWKALENIMVLEKKRLPAKTDFSNMLDHDLFHRTLFACCFEIVLFSYNSQRSFPWVLQIFNLSPYYFYKIIELLIRAEDGLSRDVAKHLNHIEEQILENLAWKSDSPLWVAIAASNLPIPSCEDVSFPKPAPSTNNSSLIVSSPLAHPAIHRVSLDRSIRREVPQSPGSITLAERFQSPAAGSNARRRLFTNSTTTIITNSHNSITFNNATTNNSDVPITNNTIVLTPERAVIALHPVQGENNVSCYQLPSTPVSQPVVIGTARIEPVGVIATPDPTPKPIASLNHKPKRTGSLGLFFRKVYHLAGVRMRELCDRLSNIDDDLFRKVWTCFEYAMIHHTDLMCDRHLDQLIMCAIYVICKVTQHDRNFQEIMRCYRLQPQAASHVYRSVYLGNRRRRTSGSSDNSKNGSGSSSPVHSDKDSKHDGTSEKDDREKKRTEQLSTIRSSSTLPVPHPSSQPPTPTRLTGTGTHFEFEDRGDIIMFYNTVYVLKVQKFAYKFSPSTNILESPPLSPLPRLNANPQSPWRRVSAKHSLYISPLTNTTLPPSPVKPLSYSFNKSPAKDLRAINNFVKSGEKKVRKRILQDNCDGDTPNKRMCPDLTLRKIQNVITERQGTGNGFAE